MPAEPDGIIDFGATPSATFTTGAADQNINGLLWGTRWTDPNLTFSFPDAGADDYSGAYPDSAPSTPDVISSFSAFTTQQETSARFWLDGFASVSGLTFTELDGATGALDEDQEATLRFANSQDSSTAYAYLPNSGETGGDMWFGNSGTTPTQGNYHWHTIGHELGHALGLSHGQTSDNGFGAMDADRDSMEFSIMTYRSYIGAPLGKGYTNEPWGYAQSLMMYDIAAIQFMYGADYSFNSDDTTYTFSETTGQMFVNGVMETNPGGGAGGSANRIFLTIWDGNGVDTFDLSNYTTNLDVDLTPGGWSTFSSTQLANLGDGNFARANVFNALLFNNDPSSLIENAFGGTGNDRLVGNSAANRLEGRGGNDTLYGGDGNDTLAGGTGVDRLYGESGSDTAVISGTPALVRFGGVTMAFTVGASDRQWLDGIETISVDGGGTISTAGLANNDPYSYLAGNADLIVAFGANTGAALEHYFANGYYEGRVLDGFDEFSYLASHGDLMGALGADGAAATQHYVAYGFDEGRTVDSFDQISYLASYGDLLSAFGANGAAATQHYVAYGFNEERAVDSFDEYLYIAGNGDLITAFGSSGPAGTQHYVQYGYGEERAVDSFDAAQYLANYDDLQAAYGDDTAAATLHYIDYGFDEGRTDEVIV